MGKNSYLWIRDLHLYLGLFVSPFVVVFAVSVFFLNHNWFPGGSPQVLRSTASDIVIPEGLERLRGMEQIEAVRPVLDRLGVKGEIGFVSWSVKQSRLVIPVTVPGRETTVTLSLRGRTATIERRNTGPWNAIVYLHRSPGPHLAGIRGNWILSRVWAWLADGVVYLLLFVSASGVYLWVLLKAERKVGLVLVGAGALTFCGLVYVLGS